MKEHLIFYSLLMMFFGKPLISTANNEAYLNAMRSEIQSLFQAGPVEELQKSANAFQRIASMNPEEWLPDYYAAWAYANMGFRTEGAAKEKDAFFRQAKIHADKAAKISPNNSEIVAIQGFITMGELSVDPMTRGQHLSAEAMQTFGKAISINRENPRALMMMAQMEWGMAQFFGQGPEKACGLLNSSISLFEKEAATIPADSILPTWGKQQALGVKQEICN